MLIKGINKQILEVTNTESPYFEKVIFFVRPEGQHLSEKELQSEAEKISAKAGRPPKIKRSASQRLVGVAFAMLGVGAGIALAFLMNMLV